MAKEELSRNSYNINSLINNLSEDGSFKVKTKNRCIAYVDEFTSAQTSEVIITPTSGKKAIITGISLETNSNSGEIRVYWGTSEELIAVVYVSRFGSICLPSICNQNGAIDETVKITTTTGTDKVFVAINYIEE